MQKNVLILAAIIALSGSSAFASDAVANLTATLPADAYDCTTVSISVDGAELDADAFTATSNAGGGCTVKFSEKAPKTYTATVKDANGVTQKFTAKDGKLVKVKAAPSTDAKLISP
jgi:hypothetical protein